MSGGEFMTAGRAATRLALVLIALGGADAMATEITRYVRYADGGNVSYGIETGDRIHQLDAAPWLDGKSTGKSIASADVTLLAPAEPSKVIAVVGLSRDKEKPSHLVASYMQEHDYRIIPVTRCRHDILGEKVYPRLEDIPEKVDVVNIFGFDPCIFDSVSHGNHSSQTFGMWCGHMVGIT